MSSKKQAEERSPFLAGPGADADRFAHQLALAIDEKDGRCVGDPVALRDLVLRVEQDRGRDAPTLQPGREQATLLAKVDREHDEPLLLELLVELLDRRGQLPRAERSAGIPEIEEGGAATYVGESVWPAVEGLQRERRRELIAERGDLQLGQEIVERVVRRGGGCQAETRRQERQDETTA